MSGQAEGLCIDHAEPSYHVLLAERTKLIEQDQSILPSKTEWDAIWLPVVIGATVPGFGRGEASK
jgi:hypothetical protein